jgi:hypothetical protein
MGFDLLETVACGFKNPLALAHADDFVKRCRIRDSAKHALGEDACVVAPVSVYIYQETTHVPERCRAKIRDGGDNETIANTTGFGERLHTSMKLNDTEVKSFHRVRSTTGDVIAVFGTRKENTTLRSDVLANWIADGPPTVEPCKRRSKRPLGEQLPGQGSFQTAGSPLLLLC